MSEDAGTVTPATADGDPVADGGKLRQNDGLPTAGDPAIQQRLDAVGNPELHRCVTRRPEGQATGNHGTRRAGRHRPASRQSQ